MKGVMCGVLLLVLSGAARAEDDDAPFGPVGKADVQRLAAFAKEQGFELGTLLDRIRAKNEEALGQLFRLSSKFEKFDDNAHAYGQMIYGFVLERAGIDLYLKVLDRQPRDVQQRIRDFLYYPLLLEPEKQQREDLAIIRREHPALFPNGYNFGRNDPIFTKREVE